MAPSHRIALGTLTAAVLVALAALVPATAPVRDVSAAASSETSDGTWDALLGVVVERLETGDEVASAKWPTRGPVEDQAREQAVLDAAAAGAAERGLDPTLVAAVFGDQIAASKVVQYGLFSDWTASPADAPPPADLAQLRPRLDAITVRLLDGLAATAGDPTCARDRDAAVARLELDALHHTALDRAVRSVCGPA